MSKNTERGIGQHVGPVADGRSDDPRPRPASETSVVGPGPENGQPSKVEVGQITLLGVAAPDLDREKATTPGRDVHLPTEVRRVAAPRAVALDAAGSGDRRKTPETPRPRVTTTSAPSIPLRTQDVMSTVNARLSETGEVPRPRFRSGGRRDFAETTLMDAVPETGRGSSIALGIVIALVAAVAVVWTLRFGPHLRAFDATVAERPGPPGDPALEPPRAAPPAREVPLPVARDGTSLRPAGEPSDSNSAGGPTAHGSPSAEETAGTRGAPLDHEPPAAAQNPERPPRESHAGSPAVPGSNEEEGRRKNQRLRAAPSSSQDRQGDRQGERQGSSTGGPKRGSAPIFRGGDAPGGFPTSPPPVGSARPVSPEPPRFEPPPPLPSPPATTPARQAPANEKPLYDPDSPLPPAAGE